MTFCIDPVCGRRVDQSKAGVEALISQHHGKTYYFCSMECKLKFDHNPHAHTTATDPICGSEVDREQAEAQGLYTAHEERRYWFCSTNCKQRFDLAPGFYTHVPQAAGSTEQRPPDAAQA